MSTFFKIALINTTALIASMDIHQNEGSPEDVSNTLWCMCSGPTTDDTCCGCL